jgi:hypothetical protein
MELPTFPAGGGDPQANSTSETADHRTATAF